MHMLVLSVDFHQIAFIHYRKTADTPEEEKAGPGEMLQMLLGAPHYFTYDFSTLYTDMRAHPEKFMSYFCMTVESFDKLLQRVFDRI